MILHFIKKIRFLFSHLLTQTVFVMQEKKFYLYALYNKNKPNSDSLMSEYGSAFFKVSAEI